jgi:citrate synthase
VSPPGRSRIGADEAARILGVRRETLYAYVSRGLIRSEPQEGTRERLYHSEDIHLLRQRKQGRRDPARAAEEALHWGTPILESGITLIADGDLYYRGWRATELAATSGFEDVVGLLWGCPPGDGLPDVTPAPLGRWRSLRAIAASLPPLEAFQVVLSAAAAQDAAAYDTSPGAVHRTGTRILRLLGAVATDTAPSRTPLAEVLQRGWLPGTPAARELIEAALILWADHELNVSTFTVRCVASARATPYAAVVAGISALRGPLHGGSSEQVEALFEETPDPDAARAVLEARLRRGERIPGFGHPLYPDGDPRAAFLLERLYALRPRPAPLSVAEALEHETLDLIGRKPNIDFASVTLRRALAAPPRSALALVGVARAAGWIAHVIEQYAEGRLIRPRARYTGEAPTAR